MSADLFLTHKPLRVRPLRLRLPLVLISALLIGALGCEKPAKDPSTSEDQAKTQIVTADPPRSDSKQPESDEPASAPAPEGAAVDGLAETTDNQQMLLLEAKKAFLTEELTRAEALFETLVKSKPISGAQVSAVIALAQIYNETGRPDKAVKLYDDLSEEVSALPEIQLVIARAYGDLNKHERAIKAYKKLLKTQPDFVFAHLELGKIYTQVGQEDAAAKAFYAYEQKIYKLAERLESPNTSPQERLQVLSIFSLVSDDRANVAVAKALKADSPEVRKQAAAVLGQVGAVEASATLEQLTMNDPSPLVRMAAQQALSEFRELGLSPDDASSGPTVVDEKDKLPSQ